MTTIAYRDGCIAADTGVTIGNTLKGRVTKIVRNDAGDLAGAAGGAGYAHKFRKWAAAGCKGKPPVPVVHNDQGFDRGVVFHADGEIEIHEAGGVFTLRSLYFAFGSGSDIAIGAMHAGASSVDAIHAAVEHDPNTFGKVEWLVHRKVTRRK